MANRILTGGDIKGDITSCKIENKLIKLDKKSPFSLTQNKTYVSYDVCTKQTIETYTVPELTEFWGAFFAIGIPVLIMGLILLVAYSIDLIKYIFKK